MKINSRSLRRRFVQNTPGSRIYEKASWTVKVLHDGLFAEEYKLWGSLPLLAGWSGGSG